MTAEEQCYNNNRQIFSIILSYVITNGENLAIKSETYNNPIYGKKEEASYGTYCVIDINPNYIPNG